MKTRSVENIDPFEGMEPAKPLAMEDIDRALRSASAAIPVATQSNVEIVSSEKNKVDFTANTSNKPAGEGWIRQELTSLCVPYKFREVWLRPLTIDSLSKLHSARVNQSFSILVDALDECINVDIRNLTPEDFVFVMHWIRDNSYPTVPIKIEHKTIYGNTVEVNVRIGDLKITELNMTREEYKVWYDKGYAFPSVRDAEVITRNEENMDPQQEWLLETAQYIRPFDENEEVDYGNFINNKLARLSKMVPNAVVEVEEFKQLIYHGVEQSVKVVDRYYEREAAIKYMEDEIARLKLSINEIPEDMIDDAKITIFMATMEINKYQKELDAIRAAGDSYKPITETVAVTLTATEFFPKLRSKLHNGRDADPVKVLQPTLESE